MQSPIRGLKALAGSAQRSSGPLTLKELTYLEKTHSFASACRVFFGGSEF